MNDITTKLIENDLTEVIEAAIEQKKYEVAHRVLNNVRDTYPYYNDYLLKILNAQNEDMKEYMD